MAEGGVSAEEEDLFGEEELFSEAPAERAPEAPGAENGAARSAPEPSEDGSLFSDAPADGAENPPAHAPSEGERSLFGDDSGPEEAARSASARGSARGSGRASRVAGASGGASGGSGPPSEILDEQDLFGDVATEARSASGRAAGAGGSGPPTEPSVDEQDLFGDVATEDEQGHRPSEGRPSVAATSEMDEREIFGDISDEEPDKVEDVILRRRPMPSLDRPFTALRLPNIISVEKQAFHPQTYTEAVRAGYSESVDSANKSVLKLLNPENVIRWRLRKHEDGRIITDEDHRPQYESNTRIVEWEDGSQTLFVGREAFNVSQVDDNVLLFEENSHDTLVCHGFVRKRLVTRPIGLRSTTHDMLKRAQYSKYLAKSRSLLVDAEAQAARLAEEEQVRKMRLEMEQRRQKRERQKRGSPHSKSAEGQQLTRVFLEDTSFPEMPPADSSVEGSEAGDEELLKHKRYKTS